MKGNMRKLKKVAIVTDSNSGITQKIAKEIGVYVVPMLFYIDNKEYLEGVSIHDEEFFEHQLNDSDIKTSQPTAGSLIDKWEELLNEYETIIHIPMSKSISGSYSSAYALSQDYEGKVFVIDNQRISVTQMQSVLDAKAMADNGLSAPEIKEYLESTARDASIYITVDTLKYLKKGGRITATTAAIGDMLNMKPVLEIQGDLIDMYKNTRGRSKSKQIMIEAIKNDINTRFAELCTLREKCIMIAHAGVEEEALEWAKEVQSEFPNCNVSVHKLSLNICTHVGKGTIGIALMFPYKK